MFKPGTLVRFTPSAIELLLSERYSVPYAKKIDNNWVYAEPPGFTPRHLQVGIVIACSSYDDVGVSVVVLFGDKLVLPFASELEEVKSERKCANQ